MGNPSETVRARVPRRQRRIRIVAVAAGAFVLALSLGTAAVMTFVVTPDLVSQGLLPSFVGGASSPQAQQASPTPLDTVAPGPSALSAAQQSDLASCGVIAGVLNQIDQNAFTATMSDPTADPEAAAGVLATVSSELNAAGPQLSSTIGMQVSSVMEALDGETTALNRYSANPSIGTDAVAEGQYSIQVSLILLADTCADIGQSTSGPQTTAKACEILNEATLRADVVNALREAKGRPAQTIAAINTYVTDLENGLNQVTNPTILAAARAADADLRAELKAVKAASATGADPAAVTDAATKAEASARSLVAACTPGVSS